MIIKMLLLFHIYRIILCLKQYIPENTRKNTRKYTNTRERFLRIPRVFNILMKLELNNLIMSVVNSEGKAMKR